MIILIIIHLFWFVVYGDRLIGTVNNTRFTSVDRLNTDSIWIDHQISPQHCLCTVLSQYSNVRLFNSYSNGSCQLFFSLPFTYTMEYNSNATIILLSLLPPVNQAPCCSNLTWLMARIQISALPAINMASPIYLVVDDLDYLAVLSDTTASLNRYNRTTMTLISSTPMANAQSLSYYSKSYFISKYLACDF